MALIQPRFSGVLLHPSSLPSPYGIGDFGSGAYTFVDFLAASGQSIWQVLPFGPTGYGDSPYQSFSAFAGQPLFISPELLVRDGLLTKDDLADCPNFSKDVVDYGYVIFYKNKLFHKAYERFCNTEDMVLQKQFSDFCKAEADWLDDYALFMVCKDMSGGTCFLEWDAKLRKPTKTGRTALMRNHRAKIDYYRFIQFLFAQQWAELKTYANSRGIRIVGDIPIFVSLDSAEMWAHPELFQVEQDGYPTVVAGVPPDYFSETGQLWGNPLYDWDYHKSTGYSWWMKRIRKQLALFDIIRIDHFRGFEAYWAIPYGEKTAVNGTWVKGPDADFFQALVENMGADLPIIAEDLGIITPEVEKLRDDFGLPGMKVLQFAFNNVEDNDLMPHHFTTSNCVCYTGTHDNDTALGWYLSAEEEIQDKVRTYMNTDGNNIHWDMIRTALGSIARYAIFPMQDLLGYGGDCRMNTPSVASGNWTFRVRIENFNDGLAAYLHKLTKLYGRLPVETAEDTAEYNALDADKEEA